MKTPLSTKQVMRYNRQIVLPQVDIDGQELLASSRILIIGVGGLGNAAATNLCGSGVGKITLIDNDIVEHTNLPRQTLFDESQVGQSKVMAAKVRLSQMNSDCEIVSIEASLLQDNMPFIAGNRAGEERTETNSAEGWATKTGATELEKAEINTHKLFGEHDIVLDCTDNAQSRDLINRLCYKHGVPLISGAAIRFEGQLFVAKPGESQCYACLRRLFSAPELSCTEAGIFSPIVNIVGTYQALLAMQVLMGVGSVPVNTLLTFDGLQHEWQQWTLPATLQCDVCGNQNKDVDEG
ncbi:Molybdopterin-synthase adenylyltransferase MoeB [Alteromonas sp. 38]|uniref:HesA/MoeB/ThiF family protein n=1 Tax=unclassified Alteromonas TaxID=2614992 RepID=UPI0012EFFB25|nr:MULTISPECIES: ThiF family adenylyltransferase [unclassified Alteromonas]CAD5271947.1 Molybdopterin-synthase adenylyltransferase MoeB [Alteromonas sp. 154]VXB49967.1 Molybdopterin-synthase adenylyltransferase MoeB [Alteromonas sp. 38]